jgi:fatty acid desaturase
METKGKNLSLAELKKVLEDCFPANPWIYWADFLCSVALGYGAFVLTEFLPFFSFTQILAFLVSVLAIYRAVLFIHELTHQERRHLPGFSVAWNLLVGVPTLFPSFMYRGVHIDHHKKNSYSTVEDGEYLPLGASPYWKTLAYVAQSLFLPALVVLRFGVLGPLSLAHPALRRQLMEKASSLAIRFDTKRKIPSGTDLRRWYAQEFLCFLYLLGMAYLFASGTLSFGTLAHIYLAMVAMFTLNSIRTVVAHRYRNLSGDEISFQDQLLDSVNIEGNPIVAELVAPVGLRYHGLHHLFPTLPYHNLGIAHRRLREQLPADSFYHQTVEPSFAAALRSHWKNTQSGESINSRPESLRA